MKILITGGFGYIGGRLAKYLYQFGHQVVLGTRNAGDSPEWLPQAEVVKTDWSDSNALAQICTGIDVVIHAAGMNAQDCALNPVDALEFNGLATSRLVDAAISAKVKRLIYLSTAHVYASPLIGIITEESCASNVHPYASSHLAGEKSVLFASQQGHIEGIVLRLSNAIGAPVHKDVNCWMLLVNDLCQQVIENGKIVLKTNGLQHRDFIGITEVCRIIEYLNSSYSYSQPPCIINVGSGISHSVFEIAKIIQKRCDEILHFRPIIERVDSGADNKYDILEYNSDTLKKMKLIIESNYSNEIDSLLAFCQDAFKYKC